jgi:hypothetical protein
MAEGIENKPPRPKAKHLLWKAGLYLTSFVFALVLLKWGDRIPTSLVAVSLCVVSGLFVLAAFLHVRDIGGWGHLHGYIQDHLLVSMSAIVIFGCLIVGTGIYLAMRHPHASVSASRTMQPMPASAPLNPPVLTRTSTVQAEKQHGAPTTPMASAKTTKPGPSSVAPPITLGNDAVTLPSECVSHK